MLKDLVLVYAVETALLLQLLLFLGFDPRLFYFEDFDPHLLLILGFRRKIILI